MIRSQGRQTTDRLQARLHSSSVFFSTPLLPSPRQPYNLDAYDGCPTHIIPSAPLYILLAQWLVKLAVSYFKILNLTNSEWEKGAPCGPKGLPSETRLEATSITKTS
ncbi:hypothetical protein O181_122727 [Austropuccinia psidii MF-1]|uniref:Uncharacterized protein n=1 Tax=Austropuccinia psidii MF-1 TaxID=1389203 RepID=A0A9Q3Q4Q3_9BASI|nr:hypothetical protein [Austropuccinia psidii MF-1]